MQVTHREPKPSVNYEVGNTASLPWDDSLTGVPAKPTVTVLGSLP